MSQRLSYQQPEHEQKIQQLKKLRGFVWREDEQPKTKEDIFIVGKKIPRKAIPKPISLKSIEKLSGKKGGKGKSREKTETLSSIKRTKKPKKSKS